MACISNANQSQLSTLQAMLRAVALAIESFEAPLSISMQDCLQAIDSIRHQAVGVVDKISAILPSNLDHSQQSHSDGQYNEEKLKPHIRFGTALKAVLMNGKKLQELRAQIKGHIYLPFGRFKCR